MKYLFVFSLCIVAALSCPALSAPEKNNAVLVRSRRDLLDNIVQLIQNLITRLQNAGKEAMEAVTNFTDSISLEAQQIREQIMNNINNFRNRVNGAIESVFQKFSNTSEAVNGCVETYKDEAANLFNGTTSLAMACVDEGIDDIGLLVQQLRAIATEAMEGAATAIDDMKTCTRENSNILSAGSCLGSVAMRIEVKSVNLLSQSTLLIGRINLSIATLPASLEVCAGSRLVQTGMQTGKIIMDVGTCSATVIFNSITGRD